MIEGAVEFARPPPPPPRQPGCRGSGARRIAALRPPRPVSGPRPGAPPRLDLPPPQPTIPIEKRDRTMEENPVQDLDALPDVLRL